MNFIDASESGLKKWITFSGRSARSEFWYYILFYWIMISIINILQQLMEGHYGIATILCQLLLIPMTLWLLVGLISVTVRRLHDHNRTGWWYWINFTIIGMFFPLFFWYCVEGTKGPNRYGPDPLQSNEGNMIQ
jgi:uncharacterized membrane protein YhaH (DUF805 family)